MASGVETAKPAGLVLAGGRSSRMGEEKSLIALAGDSLLQRAIDRLSPQVSRLVLSANGDVRRFEAYGLEVVTDVIEGYKGPLAGIFSGLKWAARQDRAASHMVSIASDTPFFPSDLVAKLQAAVDGRPDRAAVPQTGGRLHPAFGLWPLSQAPALERQLIEGRLRVHDWLNSMDCVAVPFAEDVTDPSAREPSVCDPFFNINTPQDLEAARRWLKD